MNSGKKIDEFDTHNKNHEPAPEVTRVDERRFSQQLDELMVLAEDMRIKRMRQHRARGFIAINFSIFAAIAGAAGFGWYFLIQLDIWMSLVCILIPTVLSMLVYWWSAAPIKKYKREHKSLFMPKIAKALGGLTYDQSRGINKNILDRAAVLPAHTKFHSEDCFMGTYKGVKVIFSEARLYGNNTREEPVFQGIMVLLEVGGEAIEGHTIITANPKLVQAHLRGRWKNMTKVYVTPSNPAWDIFQVYATKPETAELMVGDRLLKELAEAAAIFNNAPITAALYGKKYVFLMIPNDHDMFEASDLYIPIATQQHALNCRREISQILEIIDVFDLYKPVRT